MVRFVNRHDQQEVPIPVGADKFPRPFGYSPGMGEFGGDPVRGHVFGIQHSSRKRTRFVIGQ